MALFRTFSAAIQGIDAHVIDVEVDMYPSGTSRDFVTVGMPDAAVRESRERIKSALLNSHFGYPSKSVTINLAPANVRKEGAGFDLPTHDRRPPDVRGQQAHSFAHRPIDDAMAFFEFADGLKLVVARGRLMQSLRPGGGMLAVDTPDSALRIILDQVCAGRSPPNISA